jgi:hypothetical protein
MKFFPENTKWIIERKSDGGYEGEWYGATKAEAIADWKRSTYVARNGKRPPAVVAHRKGQEK